VVSVAQIDYITADGPYAELHVAKQTHVIRERMKTLDRRLDPKQFARIHRSTIVNLQRVASLEPYFHGRLHRQAAGRHQAEGEPRPPSGAGESLGVEF
jgi:DNA-binding LytR/AlgR family response regulator